MKAATLEEIAARRLRLAARRHELSGVERKLLAMLERDLPNGAAAVSAYLHELERLECDNVALQYDERDARDGRLERGFTRMIGVLAAAAIANLLNAALHLANMWGIP